MKKNLLFNTSKITGLLYLGLAITGMLSFLFARQKLFVLGDPLATTNNLINQEALARWGIAWELALVAFQALAAVWFYKLFAKINSFAAISLAFFGMVNAILILVSNAFWLTALSLALRNGINQAELVFSFFEIHDSLWIVGKLFFGLWLIPMGYLVLKSKMPHLLGWILISGGLGYIISVFFQIISPASFASIIEPLTIPATIGEFWIIGYLLFKKNKS